MHSLCQPPPPQHAGCTRRNGVAQLYGMVETATTVYLY